MQEEATIFHGLTCDVWVRSAPSVEEIWWCELNPGTGGAYFFPARTMHVLPGSSSVNPYAVLTEFISFTPAVPAYPNPFAVTPPCVK